MTRILLDPRTWFAMALIMLCLALCSCAENPNFPCNEACTPEMVAAQDPLQVEPVAYNDIFGKEWLAGVSVEGKTATTHFGKARGK